MRLKHTVAVNAGMLARCDRCEQALMFQRLMDGVIIYWGLALPVAAFAESDTPKQTSL